MQAIKIRISLLGAFILLVHTRATIELCAYDNPVEIVGVTCTKESFRVTAKQLKKLILKQIPIQPPGMLQDSELHGTATVELCIDKEGKISNVRAINGNRLAMQSVIESIREWTFTPYIRGGSGVPIIGSLKVKYDFRR
jgi:hypothetical protein